MKIGLKESISSFKTELFFQREDGRDHCQDQQEPCPKGGQPQEHAGGLAAAELQPRSSQKLQPPPLASAVLFSWQPRKISLDTDNCIISGFKRNNVTQEIKRIRITNTHGSFNKRMSMGQTDMLEDFMEGYKGGRDEPPPLASVELDRSTEGGQIIITIN